jgi:hypothetical protein
MCYTLTKHAYAMTRRHTLVAPKRTVIVFLHMRAKAPLQCRIIAYTTSTMLLLRLLLLLLLLLVHLT